jgi:hypothetical protein
MSFGTAFNVASNVYGMFSSSKAAKRAAQWQKYNAALQRDNRQQQNNLMNIEFAQQERAAAQAREQYERDMGFFNDQMDERLENKRYLREQDQLGEQFAQDQNRRISNQQRALERAARERRIFDLEQIANDKEIRENERKFALEQLERERRIRAKEREEEREYMDSNQAKLDREFEAREERLVQDREQKMLERDREVSLANDILRQTSNTRDELTSILEAQGNMQTPELAGEEEIGERADEKFQVLNQEIERAVDQMLSKTESDLIRRGVGTDGADSNARRAEVLARIAPAVQKAGQSAYSDALAEVTGENKIKTDRFALLRQALQDKLSNTQMAGTTGLNFDANARRTTSGVYDKATGSAVNNYLLRGPTKSNTGVTGPLSIDSLAKIYGNPNSGVADMLSMSNPYGNRTQYNALGSLNMPGSPNLSMDLTNIQSMLEDQLASANKGYADATAAGSKAGQLGGQFMQNAISGAGSFLDNRYGPTYNRDGSLNEPAVGPYKFFFGDGKA